MYPEYKMMCLYERQLQLGIISLGVRMYGLVGGRLYSTNNPFLGSAQFEYSKEYKIAY